ncbi:MAG: hypothetical protein V4568_15000 [Pseudomonadota bacterium]
MPYKHNADCRYHIPKAKYRVEKRGGRRCGLRARGGLTLWVTEDVIAGRNATLRIFVDSQCRSGWHAGNESRLANCMHKTIWQRSMTGGRI